MNKNIPIIYKSKIPRTPNTFKLNAIDRFFYVKTCIWIVCHHIHHHRAFSILFHGILSKNNIWPVKNNIELVCTMSTTGITYTYYGLVVFLAL